jgi:(E)-4-hydroxy-3-methylbut-2-enyl-diphosphate synthase
MSDKRKMTRIINVGAAKIGGNNPVLVQSMLKSRLEDTCTLLNEIYELESCGCEIIRIAIVEEDSLRILKNLIRQKAFKVPVVADIQFDCRFALEALRAGADCVRINPGNMPDKQGLEAVALEAKSRNAAVRIGINSGSLGKKIIKDFPGDFSGAIVESALETVRLFENLQFYNFKISAKASSVTDTISSYRQLSAKINYPLHVGITEAGPAFTGAIKSAVGIGILLSEGIGDTIRVSLTDGSPLEVKAAYTILSGLGLRSHGIDIISCPTCSRTEVDLKDLVSGVEKITSGIKAPLKVAIMGCIVNGPGEARDADLGIAFGRQKAAIFVKGSVIKRVEMPLVLEEFKKELDKLVYKTILNKKFVKRRGKWSGFPNII